MYKLLLCLRYFKSRAIGCFAVIGVMQCVFMMVVVVSLFTGFIDNIETAAKGLFGDIVMDAAGQHGLAHYDEFVEEVRKEIPEVQAAAPYILSYGMLRISGQEHYRHAVQIAGIRLPDHAKVSAFGNGLFAQSPENPTWKPPVEMLIKRIIVEQTRTRKIRSSVLEGIDDKANIPADQAYLLRRIDNALILQSNAIDNLRNIDSNRTELKRWEARLAEVEGEGVTSDDLESVREALAAARAEGADAAKIKQLEEQLVATTTAVARLEQARQRVAEYQQRTYEDPENRIVLGLGIDALSFRTDVGEVVRLWVPGQKVILYVFPLGRRSLDVSGLSPEIRNLSVVDDSRSGVPPIDSAFVYVPFETLQKLNHMEASFDENDPANIIEPARCSQILFKVRKEAPTERDLREVSAKIERLWLDFRNEYPFAAGTAVTVETWRQRQQDLLNTVESQRVIMIIILSVISMVALILIFVILYVIVVQKTSDIGVLKAIGASSLGVGGVFLLYGVALGTAGAALGTLLGYVFVRNTNTIADWLASEFGFRPFSYGFLFDTFPDQVQLHTVVWIVISAVIAGIVGALLPAIKAARMQPVEALRYE